MKYPTKLSKTGSITESTPAEKIVKMLSLAARPGTKAEGDAALANAQRIAKQYGVDIEKLKQDSAKPKQASTTQQNPSSQRRNEIVIEWDKTDKILASHDWKLTKENERGGIRVSAEYGNNPRMPQFKIEIEIENGLVFAWSLVAPRYGTFLSGITIKQLSNVLTLDTHFMREYREIVAERDLATKAKFDKVVHPSRSMKEFNNHRWEFQDGKGHELHITMPSIGQSRGGEWLLIQLEPWMVFASGKDSDSLKKSFANMSKKKQSANSPYHALVQYRNEIRAVGSNIRNIAHRVAKKHGGIHKQKNMNSDYFGFTKPKDVTDFITAIENDADAKSYGIRAFKAS